MLLQCAGRALLMRATGGCVRIDEAGVRREDELVWIILSDYVLEAIGRAEVDDGLVTTYVDFLISVISCEEWSVSAARAHAVTNGMRAILRRQEHLERRVGTRHKDMVLTMRLMDSIATNVRDEDDNSMNEDRELFSHCIDDTVTAAKASEVGCIERVGCLALLRCMIRCEISLIPVVQAGLDRLVGTSVETRRKFMGISRVAVLGADMRRKNVCLQWLLKTFNGIGGMSDTQIIKQAKL